MYGGDFYGGSEYGGSRRASIGQIISRLVGAAVLATKNLVSRLLTRGRVLVMGTKGREAVGTSRSAEVARLKTRNRGVALSSRREAGIATTRGGRAATGSVAPSGASPLRVSGGGAVARTGKKKAVARAEGGKIIL